MRYSRQLPLFGKEGQKALNNVHVAVAGCGGLGSNVITQLCMAGVKHFSLIDNDVIEESNLNRQFVHCGKTGKKVLSMKDWILHIDPEAEVTVHNYCLTSNTVKDFLDGADIAVDCLDSNESRLILNEECVKNHIPLVHGGVSGMYGQVTFILPGFTPCLSCILGKGDGEKVSLGSAVSVIGSIQANEVIKYVTGTGKNLKGELLIINLSENTFEKVPISRKTGCPVCGKSDSS